MCMICSFLSEVVARARRVACRARGTARPPQAGETGTSKKVEGCADRASSTTTDHEPGARRPASPASAASTPAPAVRGEAEPEGEGAAPSAPSAGPGRPPGPLAGPDGACATVCGVTSRSEGAVRPGTAPSTPAAPATGAAGARAGTRSVPTPRAAGALARDDGAAASCVAPGDGGDHGVPAGG